MSTAVSADEVEKVSSRPRLLLVEGDAPSESPLRGILSAAYEVRVGKDAPSTVADSQAFDAIVVGRRVPDGDGIALVESLRMLGVTTPILVVSGPGADEDTVRALDAGANDFVVLPVAPEVLLARLRSIRRVYTGEGPFLRVGSWEFYPESRAVYSPYEGRTLLTERENALLRLLALSPRRTFSREDILREVFSPDDHPGTVDTYVHYVRRKTDVDMITTVRGRGYRLGQL